MSLDTSKVQFTTVYQVDKIPVFSSKDDGQGLSSNGTLAVGPGDFTFGTIYIATVANPYGRRCLTTLSWSTDNVTYYPQNVATFYYNATHLSFAIQAVCFAACSDSTIYICCNTQYTANQTIYLQLALDSPT